jgi:AcrR family transcriptional regulator
MPKGAKAKSRQETPRLDGDKIVAAALAVADREGLAGTTMRLVGAELGADPTAVYRHFASKDDLVAAMADRLFGEVTLAPLPDHWRPRLGHVLRAARAVYSAHPAIIEVLANQPEESDSIVAINEIVIGCLLDAGLDDTDVGLFHQVLVSFVIGTGLHEASWGSSSADARAASRRAYAALDPRHFPRAASAASLLFPPEDDVFDFAIELLLDAIEAASRRVARARRRAR